MLRGSQTFEIAVQKAKPQYSHGSYGLILDGSTVYPLQISYRNTDILYTWFKEIYYTERSLLVILK